MEIFDSLKSRFRELPEPENLYKGLRLPENFELPNEILLFYHDFCAPAPNAHSRYTLVFPLAEMIYYVDQEKYVLRQGDILCIRPYSLRFLAPESAGYQRFFITFQLKNEQRYLPDKRLFRMSGAEENILRNVLEYYEKGNGPALSVSLYGFLTALIPAETAQTQCGDGMSREIAAALEFINENIFRSIDNAQIAGKVNMSTGNMARRFRNEVGMPVHKYILHQRLEFARYYLRKTGMHLDEIARRCGFESASGFTHFFKKKNGMPPLAYRKAAPEGDAPSDPVEE